MHRKLAIAVATLLITAPFISSAATISDLLAQLQALQQRIAALQGSAAPFTTHCPSLTRTLARGSRGADVSSLQTFLNSEYTDFTSDYITGYFGPTTEAAVKQWQREHNVVSSGSPATTGYGSVGPKTRAAIAQACTSSQPQTSRATTTTATTTATTTPPTTFTPSVGVTPPPPPPPPPPTPRPTATLTQSVDTTTSDGTTGQPFTVTWTSTNATSCTLQKTPPTGATGYFFANSDGTCGGSATSVSPGLGGSCIAKPGLIGIHHWFLDCTGPSGTVHADVYHTVSSIPPPKPFQATVVTQPALRVDCANGGCSSYPGRADVASYAYAPADINYQNMHHLFFCSAGVPQGGFDSTRYINDHDATLKPVLSVLGYAGSGTDMAACDPEVILFKGYFYLFYGSSIALNPQETDKTKWVFTNVIHVARSSSIGGPYQILDKDGTWKDTTDTPKHIISPHEISMSKSQSASYLGASWPSVVVQGDNILMWYEDDTAQSTPNNNRYYFLRSNDPAQWNTASESLTDISDIIHSGEVKFDPQTNSFVMFNVYNAHTASPWFSIRNSADGIHWSQATKVADAPPYSHNIGIESDELGSLPASGNFNVNFAAPRGLVNNISWGQWDLYTEQWRRAASPIPTASFTINGATDTTVNIGDTLNYAWSSSGGASAKTTVMIYNSLGGVVTGPVAWGDGTNTFGTTLSGTLPPSTEPAAEAGDTIVFTYTVTDSNGQSATATARKHVRGSGLVLGTIDRINHDATGYSVYGWACAAGNPSPINVHLYLGGPVGGGGTFIGAFLANVASEPPVAIACQSTGTTYRYSIPLTAALIQQYAGKPIYVYGISPTGGDNPELPRSGTLTVPTTAP